MTPQNKALQFGTERLSGLDSSVFPLSYHSVGRLSATAPDFHSWSRAMGRIPGPSPLQRSALARVKARQYRGSQRRSSEIIDRRQAASRASSHTDIHPQRPRIRVHAGTCMIGVLSSSVVGGHGTQARRARHVSSRQIRKTPTVVSASSFVLYCPSSCGIES